jgi:hypothetical protein
VNVDRVRLLQQLTSLPAEAEGRPVVAAALVGITAEEVEAAAGLLRLETELIRSQTEAGRTLDRLTARFRAAGSSVEASILALDEAEQGEAIEAALRCLFAVEPHR